MPSQNKYLDSEIIISENMSDTEITNLVNNLKEQVQAEPKKNSPHVMSTLANLIRTNYDSAPSVIDCINTVSEYTEISEFEPSYITGFIAYTIQNTDLREQLAEDGLLQNTLQLMTENAFKASPKYKSAAFEHVNATIETLAASDLSLDTIAAVTYLYLFQDTGSTLSEPQSNINEGQGTLLILLENKEHLSQPVFDRLEKMNTKLMTLEES